MVKGIEVADRLAKEAAVDIKELDEEKREVTLLGVILQCLLKVKELKY